MFIIWEGFNGFKVSSANLVSYYIHFRYKYWGSGDESRLLDALAMPSTDHKTALFQEHFRQK